MPSFFSTALTLFLIMDALGTIPTYLFLVSKRSIRAQRLIAMRESLIALGFMVLFFFVGLLLIPLLGITKNTLQIAGGIVLFLIAIKMIFSRDKEGKTHWGDTSPLVVPIAVPLIAGPSLLAMIMIYGQEENSYTFILGAIAVAWFASALILTFASPLYKMMGDKGLSALERLMGLILALIGVQMILVGAHGLFAMAIP